MHSIPSPPTHRVAARLSRSLAENGTWPQGQQLSSSSSASPPSTLPVSGMSSMSSTNNIVVDSAAAASSSGRLERTSSKVQSRPSAVASSSGPSAPGSSNGSGPVQEAQYTPYSGTKVWLNVAHLWQEALHTPDSGTKIWQLQQHCACPQAILLVIPTSFKCNTECTHESNVTLNAHIFQMHH